MVEAMRKSELYCKGREERSKNLSRHCEEYLDMVKKSNRTPVLNAKTARLAQCLAETEDQLIRDMLEATAGLLNCTGGTNGKQLSFSKLNEIIAVLKSLLIELELLTDNAEDNNAQAIEGTLCAA